MNRREFLQAAALLAAGNGLIPRSWALTNEQHAFLASQANYVDRRSVNFFSAVQRRAVAAMAEQVIPATDTPGANAAGVPKFIELMAADWFNDSERRPFMDGLNDVIRRAGSDFAALEPEQQLALLERLEDEASDAPWYQTGNVVRVWDETAPFICQFKELCVLGYFLSEVGATQALRNNTMGSFDGDIPLGPDDRAYNTLLPLRILAGSERIDV